MKTKFLLVAFCCSCFAAFAQNDPRVIDSQTEIEKGFNALKIDASLNPLKSILKPVNDMPFGNEWLFAEQVYVVDTKEAGYQTFCGMKVKQILVAAMPGEVGDSYIQSFWIQLEYPEQGSPEKKMWAVYGIPDCDAAPMRELANGEFAENGYIWCKGDITLTHFFLHPSDTQIENPKVDLWVAFEGPGG